MSYGSPNQPSRERRYRFAEHGRSQMGEIQGKHYIRNHMADVWAPKYKDGITTIRILPPRNLERPTEWEPYRFSSGPGDFGDWMRRYPAVRNFGEPGVSFIMADPADPVAVDEQMLPPWVLYNAVNRAIQRQEERPGWAGLLKGGPGRGPQLTKPGEVYFVQCVVMQRGKNPYPGPKGFNPGDKSIVMELPPSAARAMLEEMNRTIEGAEGAEGDWEQIMVHGDPISLETGRYVNFYSLPDGDPRVSRQPQQMGWNNPSPAAQGGGAREVAGYGAYLESMFMGSLPARLAEYESYVDAKVHPWDELLAFWTPEEQASFIADKFPADLIVYAFHDHPEWIPDAVRHAAAARTQGNVPAGNSMWPQQAAPVAGGQQPPGAAGGFGPPPAGQQPPAGFGNPPQGPPPQQAPPQPPQQPPAGNEPPSDGFQGMMNPPGGVAPGFGPPPAQDAPQGSPPQQQQQPPEAPGRPPAGQWGAPPQQQTDPQQPPTQAPAQQPQEGQGPPRPVDPQQAAAAASWGVQGNTAAPNANPQPSADVAQQPPNTFAPPPQGQQPGENNPQGSQQAPPQNGPLGERSRAALEAARSVSPNNPEQSGE